MLKQRVNTEGVDGMKTNQEIAQEILLGLWGNGTDRRERLTKAGYNYDNVQSIVNALVYGEPLPTEDNAPKAGAEYIKPLEIDYDPAENDGIIINILI